MEDPRRTARDLINQQEMTPWELWLRYWANGGAAEPIEFEAYVYGMFELKAIDHEILAVAIRDFQAHRRSW